MSQNQPLSNQSREQKRARFSESQKRGKTRALVGVVLFALAAVVIYGAFSGSGNSTTATTASVVEPRADIPVASPLPSQEVAVADPLPAPPSPTTPKRAVVSPTDNAPERQVVIPVADLQDGKAKFFDYTTTDKRQMRFFAIRSSDGVYRAALDACDVCYREKKGYTQDGDDMVCKKCGQRFHSALVNDVTGGCNPVAIARNVVGDKLVIKTSELESRKAFF